MGSKREQERERESERPKKNCMYIKDRISIATLRLTIHSGRCSLSIDRTAP